MGYSVNIDKLGLRAVFDLKGAPKPLKDWCGKALPAWPKAPNTQTGKDTVALAHISHQHWLLLANGDAESQLVAQLRPGDAPMDISIANISDVYEFFTITGEDASDVMSIATSLDIHPSVFSEDHACFSDFFGTRALIRRCENGFEVAVERSYAHMVQAYLDRAVS